MVKTANRITAIGPEVTNGAAEAISHREPYIVNVTIKGVADLLFHRWNCEAVAEKAKAAKGSKEKKTDNIESYVYRDDDNHLSLPGEYLRQSIIHAAKFRQDPRSPRKSAMDLYKAGVLSLTVLTPIMLPQADGGTAPTETWSYEHACRVCVQRNGVTRVRPAVKSGWEASFQLLVNLPEYVSSDQLHDVLINAGRLIGLADFRPTYGRFSVVAFDVQGAAC